MLTFHGSRRASSSTRAFASSGSRRSFSARASRELVEDLAWAGVEDLCPSSRNLNDRKRLSFATLNVYVETCLSHDSRAKRTKPLCPHSAVKGGTRAVVGRSRRCEQAAAGVVPITHPAGLPSPKTPERADPRCLAPSFRRSAVCACGGAVPPGHGGCLPKRLRPAGWGPAF
jgi:hypothetical protein